MLTKLAKLRGRSVEELRVRAAQAAAAWRERLVGASAVGADGSAVLRSAVVRGERGGAPPDPPRLLAAFRGRSPAFAGFDDPATTIAAVRGGWSGAEAGTLDRAHRATLGRFDLLGLRDLSFGSPIDWHLDPLAQKRAPLVHWSRVPYLDPTVVGDHKVVWELNRHQHLVTLGQAYWLTGDARFASAFADHVASWMDANPPKLGINWASSLEVAFRGISWVWALHYFRDAPQLTSPLYGRMLAYLHTAARHLEQYLSTYFSPNTHLTGEALGLLYLGTVFPEFREATRWREVGWRVLAEQLSVQVRADGVYFEQASYYHRYTVDFYLHAVLLRERVGDAVPPEVHAKLGLLLGHLAALVRPDGRLSLVGDDDGGRLVNLTTRDPADARATLALGAVRYDRADWAAVAQGASEELAWLAGAPGVRAFQALAAAEPAPAASRAFPVGGYFVMRDGAGAQGSYALIDCGPHGAMNCGHAHADALAIELVVRGRPVLVDSGTYTYPGEERNAFRASAAHNTATLDGESSSVPGTAFTWRSIARATPRLWGADARFAFFEGAHDGYQRLAAPAMVARSVLQIGGWGWVVADRVESAAPHTLRIHYHASPGVTVEPGPGRVVLGGPELRGDATAQDVEIVVPAPLAGSTGTFSASEGSISLLYGAREPAASFAYEVETAAGVDEIVTFVVPRPVGAGPVIAVEEHASSGRIFALSNGLVPAVVLRGGDVGAVAGQVETDAAWLWLSPSLAAPDGFVLVGGTRLVIAGERVVDLAVPAAWAVGERHSSGWRVRHGRLDRLSQE